MTAADLLAPIREREQAATKGPWGAYAGCIRQARSWRDPSEVVVDYGGERPSVPNALFIAASRTDIPRLLAALDGVLALHTSEDDPDHSYRDSCFECLDTWPCPTVAAVVAALQEGDK